MPRTTNQTDAESRLGQSHDDATRSCFTFLSDAGTYVREELSLHDRPVACPVNISITRFHRGGGVRVEYVRTPSIAAKQGPIR